MLARFRAAGLVWPTLATLAALAVLIGLGTWQMQRKAWKDGLLGTLAARTMAAPQPLPLPETKILDRLGVGQEYLRVRVAGLYLHAFERHLYMPGKQGPGWLVFTPLQLEDGRVVVVNRGWVPEALKDAAKRPQSHVERPQEVVGLIRLPRGRELFAPENDPVRNMWYWRDIAAMLGCLPGKTRPDYCKTPAKLYPYAIDAEAKPENPNGWPTGGTTNLILTNRHLEYALTWYGLALTLIGVYLAFARGRLEQVVA